MGYKLREIAAGSKFRQELILDAIARAVPLSEIQAALAAEAVCAHRERKLNMVMTVLVTIAMNLDARIAMGAVRHKIAQGLRYIWPDPEYPVAQASAFSYRRYQVGPRPLAKLFHRVCRPMTTPETPGAFLCGLRLMALDGTVEDVPDTTRNVAAFGRQLGARGDSAFAQIQAVYLAECGTHTIVDGGFWPCRTSERVGGFRMRRSLTPDMRIRWDRGFHAFVMFQAVLHRHAHALGRLPAQVKPQGMRSLPDGSYLAYIYPAAYQRRKRGERLRLRIIEYTITAPALPGYGELHRLATTLLADPAVRPSIWPAAIMSAGRASW